MRTAPPISRLASGCLALALAALALTLTVSARQPIPQPPAAPAIDPDDIGGVVTGPKGPEAGVWVIAETRDLGVRYIKSVVTDDRGRYVVPDLPAASYVVWARGYGLVDSPRDVAKPGQILNITAIASALARRRRPLLPGHLLVLDAEDPGRRRVRRQGRRHLGALIAAAVDLVDEEHRLRRLPSARPAVHAHHPASARHLRHRRRGLEAAGAVGPVGRDDARPAHQPRRALVRQLRRLDRSHRQGRAAVCHAAASPGRRAQHRRHAARLDGRQALPPRPRRQRSPPSHRERLRPALRLARVQLRRDPDPRPGEERRHDLQGAGARPADAAQPRPRPRRRPRSDDALALLGQRADLGDPGQQPQLDVRQGRPAVAGRVGARRRQPGVVQGRLRSSVGQGVPDGAGGAPPVDARPEDDEVHLHRDLLFDPPSAVRLRRQRHAVDQRRRAGGRLAEHEEVRRHRRRRGVAGLDGAGARHQRQRQARRLRRARPAARSQPRTSASTRRSTR